MIVQAIKMPSYSVPGRPTRFINGEPGKELEIMRKCVLFLASISLLIGSIQPVIAQVSLDPLYGAPFTNNSSYGYGNIPPQETVSMAVDLWWEGYRKYWGVQPYGDLSCSYDLTSLSDGEATGTFARMALTGECGGGGAIEGTAYCPDGYTLSGSACEPDGSVTQYRLTLPQSPDEDPGPSCPQPQAGNPITVATGNKHQHEVDWRDPRGRLDFIRHYSYRQANEGVSHWRHRFHRRLETVTHSEETPPRTSGWYASREAACLQGSQELAAAVTDVLGEDDWEASFSNGTCQLSGASVSTGGGSSRVMAVVLDNDDESSEPDLVRLHRPDASVRTFYPHDGGWRGVDGSGTRPTMLANGYWRYHTPAGERETYNDQGRLTQLVTAQGRTLTFTYNIYNMGQLESVTDEQGRSLQFSYNNGQVSGISGPSGSIASYQYSNGRLMRVDYPDGTSRNYHYEDNRFPDALTGITDENGARFASWEYDDQGRAVVSEHAGGAERTTLDYHDDGSTTVTNPLGKETTYHFTTINGVRKVTEVEGHPTAHCAAANQSYTYTPEGWVESKTDWNGNTTTYEYNDRGLVIRKVEAVGTPEQRVTEKTWHPEYRLPDVVTEPDRVIDHDYDEQGRLISRQVRETN